MIARILLLALLPAALANAEWFASNALGLEVEPIAAEQLEQYEYTLEVTATPGVTTKTLYREGEPIEQDVVRVQGRRRIEEHYEDGELESIQYFDSNGLLEREERYVTGELDRVHDYEYFGRTPILLEVSGPGGSALYRERYYYWGDGMLRRLDRTTFSEDGGDPIERVIEYSYRGRRLVEEWIDAGGRTERFRFDTDGNLAVRELRSSAQGRERLLEREERTYRSDETLAQVRVWLYDTEESVLRRYDEQGRMIEQITQRSGEVSSRLLRAYEGSRVARETLVSSEGTQRWEYRYTGGNEPELASVRYLRDGQLQQVTTYDEESHRVEEIYHRGRLVLKAYYVEERKTKEEVFADGEVVTTRSFGADSPSSSSRGQP